MKTGFIDASALTKNTSLAGSKSPAAVVYATNNKAQLKGAALAADKATKGLIKKTLGQRGYTGKAGETISLTAPAGFWADTIIIVGLGAEKDITSLIYEKLGGNAIAAANAAKAVSLVIALDITPGKPGKGEAEAHALLGATMRSYRFDKYRTTEKKDKKPTVANIKVAGDKKAADKAYKPLNALAEGVALTRDVVTEPGNVIYPETFMKECKKLSKLGVKIDVLTEAQMKKLGFGALLGVGQGSVRDSYTVIMRWEGAAKSKKPVAFIGKGVTFDTGGISIKPSNGMDEMKFDMGGAGTVLGLMHTLAARKAKCNVIGAVGLVENMPDANAQRPGDVVTSYSGQTIEVLNTDAEGRLVLADVLAYVNDKHKPEFMINLATLTGAILVALGDTRAGLFSNSDTLCDQLSKVAKKTGEPVWRLPLGDEYDEMINSPIADMQNIGADRIAGSITAGQFLQRFVGKTPWVHIDIAGTAWTKKDRPTCPKGATAYGVKLLDALVQEYYEK